MEEQGEEQQNIENSGNNEQELYEKIKNDMIKEYGLKKKKKRNLSNEARKKMSQAGKISSMKKKIRRELENEYEDESEPEYEEYNNNEAMNEFLDRLETFITNKINEKLYKRRQPKNNYPPDYLESIRQKKRVNDMQRQNDNFLNRMRKEEEMRRKELSKMDVEEEDYDLGGDGELMEDLNEEDEEVARRKEQLLKQQFKKEQYQNLFGNKPTTL